MSICTFCFSRVKVPSAQPMALTSRAQNCARLSRSLKIFFEKRMRLGNSNKFDCARLSRSLKIFFEKRMRLGNSNKFDCTRLSRSLK